MLAAPARQTGRGGSTPLQSSAEEKLETRTIKIEGMHCDGCAGRVKRVLEREPGVRQADVSYQAGEARVTYNEQTVSPDQLGELIEGAGYTAEDAP
ncbi:MAG: heavy-metal-associated domain-containing protein [Gemmatimonadetes bacterium]|nr:heavy-metal-associated domain-containing protein [Gemmatimonadota bacterium]